MAAALPKKIIVAIDGSEPSFKAAEYAIRLAVLAKSELIALLVMFLPPYASPETLESLRRELAANAESPLARARKMAKERGLNIETRAVETSHSVVRTIADYAEQVAAALIVVGTRGTGGKSRRILGSVAGGVVEDAHCPVLVV